MQSRRRIKLKVPTHASPTSSFTTTSSNTTAYSALSLSLSSTTFANSRKVDRASCDAARRCLRPSQTVGDGARWRADAQKQKQSEKRKAQRKRRKAKEQRQSTKRRTSQLIVDTETTESAAESSETATVARIGRAHIARVTAREQSARERKKS